MATVRLIIDTFSATRTKFVKFISPRRTIRLLIDKYVTVSIVGRSIARFKEKTKKYIILYKIFRRVPFLIRVAFACC